MRTISYHLNIFNSLQQTSNLIQIYQMHSFYLIRFQLSFKLIISNTTMRTILKTLLLSIYVMAVNCLYCQPYNCYELLQIPNTATTEQIKKAFRLMAKRHHPDRNKVEDTTQLFQKINLAYEILQNDHTRKAYDYFIRDPSGSRAYHTYQFYRASYSPQVNPFFVLFVFVSLLSWLQWVMRKQMYQSAIESIVNSEGFKKQVNEECLNAGKKGDKRYKQEVAERLQKQISISGGYSMPEIKDMLIFRIVLLPYTIFKGIKSMGRWIWKYYIKREQYDEEDQSELTRKVLKVPKAQWISMPEQTRKQYMRRKMWIRQNFRNFQQQMQQKQLQEIRETNPAKYRKIMNYLKKNK